MRTYHMNRRVNAPEDEHSMTEDLDQNWEQEFPWEDIEASRKNKGLQQKHPLAEALLYRAAAKGCPSCGAASGELAWIYFESPPWTWEALCGRAVWITVCDEWRLDKT